MISQSLIQVRDKQHFNSDTCNDWWKVNRCRYQRKRRNFWYDDEKEADATPEQEEHKLARHRKARLEKVPEEKKYIQVGKI